MARRRPPLDDPRATARGRVPELDGVRGVAILLVLTAHLLGGAFPANRPFIRQAARVWGGGFAGVQLFFALSGFLITSVLLREFEGRGTASLRHFYLRRARRLLPALVVMCAAYAVYAVIALHGSKLRAAGGSIAYALTYTTNIKSLLPRLPDSLWLGHTWSLAVEEQFYLLWPVCFLVVMRLWGRQGVAAFALLGVAITIGVRELTWHGPHSFGIFYERVRYDALLFGCALAARPIRVRRELVWLAGAYLLFFSLFPPSNLQRPYPFTATALASGIFVVGCTHVPWLRHRVLIWFGLISYGLYLWHVFVLRFGFPGPVSLVVSLVMAHLSWVLVERRFLADRSLSAASPASSLAT
jgi:peptidoglycan/LPS O-acetylase OafA/YrhL